VAAVALVILAVVINIAINRKRFYRRGAGGQQHFNSYGKAVATTWLERFGKLFAIVLVLLAIVMMGKGYEQHKNGVQKEKVRTKEVATVIGYFRENGRSFRFQSDAAFRFKLTLDYGAKWPFWLS